MTKPVVTKDTTADQINALHAEILGAARTTVDKAIRVGELLTAQKARCKHGQWLPWVRQKLEFEHATASRYMSCYERREELKLLTVRNLSDAYKMLGAPKSPAQPVNGENEFVYDDRFRKILKYLSSRLADWPKDSRQRALKNLVEILRTDQL